MKFNDEVVLTKRQRTITNVIAGVYTVACGILLLIIGLGVIDGLTVVNVWLPCVLTTVGLTFLTTGIYQGNVVSVWLAVAFIVPGVISFLAHLTSLTYAQLYPLYIATPGLCSLVTAALSRRAVLDHIKVATFFIVIAAAFMLKSFGVVGWSVTLPVVIVFIGLAVMLGAINRGKEKDNE